MAESVEVKAFSVEYSPKPTLYEAMGIEEVPLEETRAFLRKAVDEGAKNISDLIMYGVRHLKGTELILYINLVGYIEGNMGSR